MATLRGVEIFAPGHWFPANGPKEGVKLDLNYVKRLAINTAKKGIKAILKLGHSTSQILKGQTDGDPALGIAENFRMQGDKIIADFIDVPEILFRAIKKKLFKSVSVEIRSDANGPFIERIAILGADLPAVESLKDLQAFFSQGMPDETMNFAVMSWDESGNQWRARMRDPNDFLENTFRTKDLDGVQGIQIITGRLKVDKVPENSNAESAVLQSYHFSKEFFTLDQAKKWAGAHNLSEKSEFSLNFSEPFMDECFFTIPIKDEKMGDERKEIIGVDPAEHAKVLARLEIEQFKMAEMQNVNAGLMQFKQKIENSTEAATLAELEAAQAKIKILESEKLEFSQKDTAARTELETLRQEVQNYKESEKTIQFAIKKADAMELYKQDVKDGKLAPALPKELEACFDEQKINFSADAELNIPAKLAQKISKAYAEGGLPSGEQGSDETGEPAMQFANASERLEHETLRLQAKNSALDYKAASDLAIRLNPKLDEEYQKWLKKEYAA